MINTILTYFLLIAYMVIGFVPYYGAVDKMSTQFFYLNIVNIINIFFYIYYDRIKEEVKISILSKNILLVWGLYFIWALSTYFFALNKSEVIIESFRIFTYLITFFNLSILIKINKKLIRQIPLIFSIILLYEVYSVLDVFIERNNYEGGRDIGIRAFTGNINITAFAIILKLPFILYTSDKFKLSKFIISILLVFIFSTIFLLGSRAANLSLILFILFLILFYLKNRRKTTKHFFLNKNFLVGILFSFFLSIIINNSFFEKTNSINFLNRTVNFNTSSTNQRLDFYLDALNSFISNPISGIGIGNWKLFGTEFRGENMIDYQVPYYVHNDYLQILAEVGLIGFVLFYSVYFFIFKGYYWILKKHPVELIKNPYLILLLTSLAFFLIDSFFNFPFTRPVIFIVNIILIVLIINQFEELNYSFFKFQNIILKKYNFLIFLILPFLAFSLIISKKTYDSFVNQNFLILAGRGDYQEYSNDYVLSIDGKLPNITATTLPIQAMKANLLMNNGDYSENTLNLIEQGTKDNPFLHYGDVLKGIYFLQKRNIDSSYLYAKKAFYGFPNQLAHFSLLADLTMVKKDSIELKKAYNFLSLKEDPSFAKKYLENIKKIKTNFDQSENELINNLIINNPKDDYFKALNIIRKIGEQNVEAAIKYSNKAENHFKNKEFLEAAIEFENAFKSNPLESAYYENAANSYMQINEDSKGIEILENMLKNIKVETGKAEYLLGVMHISIKQKVKGCQYFELALAKGFKIPNLVIDKFCLKTNYEEKNQN